jgi:hypothetical protein
MGKSHVRRSILLLLLLWAGSTDAAVEHIAIRSNLELKPGDAHVITVEATQPAEIGWRAVQPTPCVTDCVEATDVTGGINYAITTRLGASMKYTPASGKITVKYKNVSNDPVTIDVYRVRRTCEAEACKFLDERQKRRWLVFKVDRFTSIETSKDESFSVISGVALGGRSFRFRAVWWTDDRRSLLVNCVPSVKRYLSERTPKDRYSPYIISGPAIGDAEAVVLTSIDTCAPKAPNFGVPEEHVFK